MMIQKIPKFGNSLAVVIPAAKNGTRRIEPGSMVEVVETADGWHVRPVTVVPQLAPELRKMADEVAETRAKVFEALAE